jgi:mono/diheme cytochrome c family protein
MSLALRWFVFGAIAMLLVLALGAGAFVSSGAYAIGADQPHLPVTRSLIDALRNKATEAAGKQVAVPTLGDPTQIADGAAHYDALCTGCHLTPGHEATGLSKGLYPQPPNLAQDGIDNPGEAFWIIKHGIKLTAMPAWGKTQSDAELWNLVAFLQRVPKMTPAQYGQWVAKGNSAHGGS